VDPMDVRLEREDSRHAGPSGWTRMMQTSDETLTVASSL